MSRRKLALSSEGRAIGKKMPSRRSVVLFGSILVIIGLLGGGVSATRAMREWNVKRTWRQTPCVITSAKYEQAGHTRRQRGTRYVPVIEYRYVVDGRTYTSDRFGLRRLVYRPKQIGPVIESYPVGSTHSCYVDPADAAQSVLVVREWPYRIGMIMGLIFVGLGCVVIWSSTRLPSRNEFTVTAHPR